MFGIGKKNKNFDLLILKPSIIDRESEAGKAFYQILFPSVASSDFIQLMIKLQKSKLNTKEILGDLGGFTILTHIEGLEKITIMDQVHTEADPIPFQDFANQVLNKFNNMLSGEELNQEEEDELLAEEEGQDDLVYFIGEFTLMRDGSF